MRAVGILGRLSEVLGKEQEYSKYKRHAKHPRLSYILDGSTPEHDPVFEARLAEEARAAARRKEKLGRLGTKAGELAGRAAQKVGDELSKEELGGKKDKGEKPKLHIFSEDMDREMGYA